MKPDESRLAAAVYANGLMEETLRGTLLAIAGRDFAAMTGLNGLLRELHLDATASRIGLLESRGQVFDSSEVPGGSRLQRTEYGQICPRRKIFRQKR